MLKEIFIPNRINSYVWINFLALIILLVLGKIEPYTIIFGYFLESIIIGLFTIVKMYLASKYDGSNKSIWIFIPFFIFHYGMFIGVQSIFAFAIISFSGNSWISEPFDLIENYTALLSLEGMEYILPLFFATQILKLIFDFIALEKHKKFAVQEIMFMPYARIFIQQFTVIIAMFFVVLLNAGLIAAILLLIFRSVLDFYMIGIRESQTILDKLVDKFYNGKVTKEQLRKQLLLFSE